MAEPPKAKDSGTAEFLSAEQAAQELVRSLRSLQQATENYAAAEKKLGESGARLNELAEATKTSGEKVADGIQAMRSMSGPEILGEIRNTQGIVREQQAAVVTEQSKHAQMLDALSKKIQTVTYLAAASTVFALGALVVALLK